MGKEKKATRKFKQQKLKGELERRKKVKDFKGKKPGGGGKPQKKHTGAAGKSSNGEDGKGAKKVTESEKSSQRSAPSIGSSPLCAMRRGFLIVFGFLVVDGRTCRWMSSWRMDCSRLLMALEMRRETWTTRGMMMMTRMRMVKDTRMKMRMRMRMRRERRMRS